LLYALKHAFNGALTPMLQCLLETGDLNASELTELELLIKEKKKRKAVKKVNPNEARLLSSPDSVKARSKRKASYLRESRRLEMMT